MAEEIQDGTVRDAIMADLQGTETGPEGTDDIVDDATSDAPEQDDAPLADPATWPEELKPHWSRMTREYNRRLDELRSREQNLTGIQEKASWYDQFASNPEPYLEQVARQLGYNLTREQSQTSNPASAVEEALGPDLKFLAPAIQKAAEAIAQQQIQPLRQERDAEKRAQQTAEFQRLAADLESRAPGWRQRETEMLNRLNFLRDALNGGTLTHPQYGNVLDMLWNWTTGNGRAVAEAGRRMARAGNQRTTTGLPAVENEEAAIAEQIGKAKTMRDKVEVAFRAAMAEHGG